MENMLQRMDKYAKTMETLVEEKAKHVVLEKKRADDLLYSILPVAIANKLIKSLHYCTHVPPHPFTISSNK